MNKLIPVVLLMLLAMPAFSDGSGTYIQWAGWTVRSTEDIYWGHKHTSFPLTYLLDDDPNTAWVFSGTGQHMEGEETGYAITLERDKSARSVVADSLWIMNGYNKSAELFLRNNRITELELYINGRFLKTVELTDSMGWHKISIPRRPIGEIKLRFTKFEKGRDNDVCVSELALYNQGKKVDLKMPKAVLYTPGSDCGDGQEYDVIDRAGKRLASHDNEWPFAFSPSGRYLAGSGTADGKSCDLWIADLAAGEVILRRSVFGKNDSLADDIRWKGEHSVVVEIETLPPGAEDDSRAKYRTETIRIAGH